MTAPAREADMFEIVKIRIGNRMKQKIEHLLMTHNYKKIPSSLPEFTMYYEEMGNQVNIIHAVDYHKGMELTNEQYQHVKEQIQKLFLKKGYTEIKICSLFLTEDVEAVKELCVMDSMSWVLDTCSKRLVVYEGHIDEFYGARRMLEDMLSESEVNSEQEYAYDREIRNQKRATKGILISNLSPINACLVLVNIIVFLGLEIFGSTTDLSYMVEKGALFPPYIEKGHQYYRLFTCMFMHFGFQHIFYNMLALYFLGDNVERALGKTKYLLLYLISGLGASSFSLIYAVLLGNNIVSAGASGAIFGVVGALLFIVIRNKGRLEDMTTAKLLLLIGYSLFSGLTSEGIDNAAHIGGLLVGFLLAVILYRRKSEVSSYED